MKDHISLKPRHGDTIVFVRERQVLLTLGIYILQDTARLTFAPHGARGQLVFNGPITYGVSSSYEIPIYDIGEVRVWNIQPNEITAEFHIDREWQVHRKQTWDDMNQASPEPDQS